MSIDLDAPIATIGEKRLIEDFIRPLFEPAHGPRTIGDDCALIVVPAGGDVVVSTDRVPADLIAFRHGIIGYSGLGRYLAALNISDISASGGQLVGLLLNLGLPSDMKFGQLKDFCEGFLSCTTEMGARVLGGDVTASGELSVAATGIGIVPKGRGLRRNGAEPGDWVFLSKPIGVTPAAFSYLLTRKVSARNIRLEEHLFTNFTHPRPLPELGRALMESGACTSCMDNTDGYSESFYELSRESDIRVVIETDKMRVPNCVLRVAAEVGATPIELAFGPGADFGLVGTIKASHRWLPTLRRACSDFTVVGRVEEGNGVVVETLGHQEPVARSGWNYFSDIANQLVGTKLPNAT